MKIDTDRRVFVAPPGEIADHRPNRTGVEDRHRETMTGERLGKPGHRSADAAVLVWPDDLGGYDADPRLCFRGSIGNRGGKGPDRRGPNRGGLGGADGLRLKTHLASGLRYTA